MRNLRLRFTYHDTEKVNDTVIDVHVHTCTNVSSCCNSQTEQNKCTRRQINFIKNILIIACLDNHSFVINEIIS